MIRTEIYTGSTDDASGYVYLRADGDDVSGVGPRYVAIHRLASLAWGLIDSLDDPREIHHIDGVPTHNAEQNLEALGSDEHGRLTREQVERRVEA